LTGVDPQEIAQRARCRYVSQANRQLPGDSKQGIDGYWVINFLGREYRIDPIQHLINEVAHNTVQRPADFMEQLCILAYLIKAQDIPLADKLTGVGQLDSGEFFFRGIHEMPTEKIAAAFGICPQQLCEAGEALGGRRVQYGDGAIELQLLPRIPITIIVWAEDEEFPARASILFDQTAADHIALDALQAAVNLVVKALIGKVADHQEK